MKIINHPVFHILGTPDGMPEMKKPQIHPVNEDFSKTNTALRSLFQKKSIKGKLKSV
jgi:hypothetical protein